MHPLDAWNSVQIFHVQTLATSYGDHFVIAESNSRISGMTNLNEDTKECFELLLKLDALTRINNDLSSLLEAEYFNGHHA
jgi:hypothetical protein